MGIGTSELIIFIVGMLAIFGAMFLFVKSFISGIKRTIKSVKKESLSKIDFSKDKDYYRDILKNYSPAELSYVDDFEINIKREVVATLLKLELKKKIEIKDNEIIILDSNLIDLKKSEKYILTQINNGRVNCINGQHFKNLIREEASDDELVERNTPISIFWGLLKRHSKKMLYSIIMGIISVIASGIIEHIDFGKNNETFLIIFIILFAISMFYLGGTLFASFIGGFVYLILKSTSDHRTKKGEEVNKKIEGLKQYIKDYSMLEQSEKEALEIWEDYLIYSVIFDINATGIVEKLSKLIL